MKMTITIHGCDDDFASDIERMVEDACAYFDNGGMEPNPECYIECTADDEEFSISKCAFCGVPHYERDLDKDGMCEDCAYEIKEGKEV